MHSLKWAGPTPETAEADAKYVRGAVLLAHSHERVSLDAYGGAGSCSFFAGLTRPVERQKDPLKTSVSEVTVEADSMTMEWLLVRSATFDQAASACFPATGALLALSDHKHELVAAACILCIEHSRVLRSAFAVDAPSSGSALLRLQYEALLRGAWLMFAATPPQIGKLASDLNVEAEQGAKYLPGYSDMLDSVRKAAPEGLTAPLEEFNQYSRHALNSFVHSGIHALHRTRYGYPQDMAVTVVRFSNGLSHLGYRLLASLSGSQNRMDRVTRLYVDFSDCMPMKPI